MTGIDGQNWQFALLPSGQLAIGVWNAYIRGNTVLTGGQWRHVAVVLIDDGSPTVDELKLCVDGIQESMYYNVAMPIDTDSSDDVEIGTAKIAGVNSFYFKGLLDEVRIYDRALTDGEIAALAQ